MRTKTLFYALLAMVIVGMATSCRINDEHETPTNPVEPEVTIVQNEVEGKPANVVSFTITTTNAVEGYWYIGDAITGVDYVLENGTKFTEESIEVEYTMSWNDTKCIWVVVISKDGKRAMEFEDIFVGEDPNAEPEPEPEPEPEKATITGVYGYYGKTIDSHFDVYFKVEGKDFVEVRFTFGPCVGSNIIPEGTYLYDDSESTEQAITIHSGFVYINDIGRYVKNFRGASLEVKHIGNEYQIVASAEGSQDGEVFECEWTGQIESGDFFLVGNPGEEPNNGLTLREDSAPTGYFYAPSDSYYLDFSFYNNDTFFRGIVIYLYVEPGSDGVIPEGHYVYGGDTLPYISEDSKIVDAVANTVANIESLTLDVEHVGNKYHVVISAEDTLGYIYEADWEGHFQNCWFDWPIYNPGEAPTE